MIENNMISIFTFTKSLCHCETKNQDSHLNKRESVRQDGFVLITAMMILIVLSLLGIAALNTATFETMISGNERQYQRQFFYSDAAINAMLGEDNRPKVTNLPGALVNLNTISCNNLQGHTSFDRYDVDGVATTPDTELYYIERLNVTPFEVRVLSCADWGNSVVGITAGVRFGSGPVNPGNPTSYSN